MVWGLANIYISLVCVTWECAKVFPECFPHLAARWARAERERERENRGMQGCMCVVCVCVLFSFFVDTQ